MTKQGHPAAQVQQRQIQISVQASGVLGANSGGREAECSTGYSKRTSDILGQFTCHLYSGTIVSAYLISGPEICNALHCKKHIRVTHTSQARYTAQDSHMQLG